MKLGPLSRLRPSERALPLLAVLVAVVLVVTAGVVVVVVVTGETTRESAAIRLVAIDDFHGSLRPTQGEAGEATRDDGTVVEVGGAAFLATHIAQLRAST